MNFREWLPQIINGGVSIFNFYILFKIKELEKENSRREQKFIQYKKKDEQETNSIKNRLLDIEMEISKRWSTWNKKYDTE